MRSRPYVSSPETGRQSMPPTCWKYVNWLISWPSSHTCQPRPQAPSVGRLPVVLDEAHVVLLGMRADREQRLEVQILDVERRRLEDHLELVELLQAVRVVAVAAVGRATRRLDERDVPRLGADRAQERGRVVRAGADLGVVGLHEEAALLHPEILKREDQLLEVHGGERASTRSVGEHARIKRSRCRRALVGDGRLRAGDRGGVRREEGRAHARDQHGHEGAERRQRRVRDDQLQRRDQALVHRTCHAARRGAPPRDTRDCRGGRRERVDPDPRHGVPGSEAARDARRAYDRSSWRTRCAAPRPAQLRRRQVGGRAVASERHRSPSAARHRSSDRRRRHER